jgi:hypothetical protein
MGPTTSLAHRRRRRYAPLLVLTLAGSAVVGGTTETAAATGPPGLLSVRHDVASTQHKPGNDHKTKKRKTQKSSDHPCLEGTWTVTSMTLSTAGLTFTGGAGTTVDIASDGDALGNFTPSTPLTGSEGSAKFDGTITDHYGFSPHTTAHSGTFPVSTVADSATITVAGETRPVTSSPEQGSYSCTGKTLSLTFTSGGNTLTYQLSSSG